MYVTCWGTDIISVNIDINLSKWHECYGKLTGSILCTVI